MSQTLSLPIRVTIAQIMWGILVVAVFCAWPFLLIPAVPIAIIGICWKLRSTVSEIMIVVVLFGVLAGLLIPAVHTNCRVRRSPTTITPIPLSSLPLGVFTIDGPGGIARLTDDGQEKARPMWSPDGSHLAFARHESGSLHIWQYVMTANDPKSASRLTDRKAPDFHGAYFPDGKRLVIATVTLSGTQGNVDIAVISDDGKNLKTVVGDISGKLSHQDWPSSSGNGERFAFSSTHEGNQEIYTCKNDGTDVIRLTQSPGHEAHPSWSAKHDVIAFATDRWGGLEIATVKPDGTGLARITKSPGIDDFPAFSPDGSRIAFVSHRDGNAEIYVMDADGSNPINITNHAGRDTQPSWTPDGSGITFVSDREGGTDLYTIGVSAK